MFEGLGDLPGGLVQSWGQGVSADGLTATGLSRSAAGVEAFRWTRAAGMTGLGDLPGGRFDSRGFGASQAGAILVGDGSTDPNGFFQAYLWTAADGIQPISRPDALYSTARGVSYDGSVVTGLAFWNNDTQAYRWTAASGMVGIGFLPDGSHSEAHAVSGDGSTIVGGAVSDGRTRAFRWTLAAGMLPLGVLAGGSGFSEARAVSQDGTTIVGVADDAGGLAAFRWTPAEGIAALGDLPGGQRYSEALGVSADGGVVVGIGVSELGFEPVVWYGDRPPRSIRAILVDDLGADLTGWALGAAAAVSADGETIVGTGTNPAGETEGWIAVIPRPTCAADFDGDQAVGLSDLLILLGDFGNPGPGATADADGDGDTDLDDLLVLLAQFGGGCV